MTEVSVGRTSWWLIAGGCTEMAAVFLAGPELGLQGDAFHWVFVPGLGLYLGGIVLACRAGIGRRREQRHRVPLRITTAANVVSGGLLAAAGLAFATAGVSIMLTPKAAGANIGAGLLFLAGLPFLALGWLVKVVALATLGLPPRKTSPGRA